jgi:hypothetical protein
MNPITAYSPNFADAGSRRRLRRTGALIAAAGLVILAACGASPALNATSAGTSEAAATVPAPTYAMELRSVLEELVISMKVPSAVVLVRSSTFGDATFELGTRVLGSDDPPTTTDHYRID